MIYSLQNRWLVKDKKLIYYGMRSGKNLNCNIIKLNKAQTKILLSLPRALSLKELKKISKFTAEKIVISDEPNTTPTTFERAKFCKNCCANDFMIPGLEFDENGLCPMCQTKDRAKTLKSVVPAVTDLPRSKKSRFDVAVFYTGGKDSTYLLYYLAKVKKLKVLALTWEIPYASESALKSIENAKKQFETVEFVTRRINDYDMKRVYKALYSLSANTCACPSLAYVMFYPTLVEERIPYFVVGNEPSQLTGLYYNGLAPKLAYSFADKKFLNFLISLGRILTFRPPLKRGQYHTLVTMKQFAFGTGKLVKLSGYSNDLVDNVTTAIHSVPEFLPPFKKSVRRSSRTGRIPAFVQVDFNEISGGTYDWTKIKKLLKDECGWIAPEDEGKGLHTSCKIEKCKEHSQFNNFYAMKSRIIPFSAIEISLAVITGAITREQAMYEIENTMGFSLDEIEESKIMCGYFND